MIKFQPLHMILFCLNSIKQNCSKSEIISDLSLFSNTIFRKSENLNTVTFHFYSSQNHQIKKGTILNVWSIENQRKPIALASANLYIIPLKLFRDTTSDIWKYFKNKLTKTFILRGTTNEYFEGFPCFRFETI